MQYLSFTIWVIFCFDFQYTFTFATRTKQVNKRKAFKFWLRWKEFGMVIYSFKTYTIRDFIKLQLCVVGALRNHYFRLFHSIHFPCSISMYKPPLYLYLIFEISISRNWFLNLIFCLNISNLICAACVAWKNSVQNGQKLNS